MQRQVMADHARSAESLDVVQALFAWLVSPANLTSDGRSRCLNIVRVDVCRSLAADFCHGHAIRSHNRATTRLRFDNGPSETLLKRREKHQVSARIQCPQFFVARV